MVMIRRPLDRSPGAPQRFQAALAEVVGRLLAARRARARTTSCSKAARPRRRSAGG
jgi:hypothetical protein